jgi:hypothetical protein
VIYLSLFTISFLAATILPLSSELMLAGLIATSNYDNLLLLIGFFILEEAPAAIIIIESVILNYTFRNFNI